MGQIINEGLSFIGRIDDNGYVFDKAGDCVAYITDSGYISEVGGGKTYGKIDADGTIRDASLSVVGRIQADGYAYIHGERICKISSSFIESITPEAWNAGEPSSYSGRDNTSTPETYNNSSSVSFDFLFSPFFIKLIIGIIVGIVAMVMGLGGAEMLLAGPIVVFLFSLIFKIFN